MPSAEVAASPGCAALISVTSRHPSVRMYRYDVFGQPRNSLKLVPFDDVTEASRRLDRSDQRRDEYERRRNGLR